MNLNLNGEKERQDRQVRQVKQVRQFRKVRQVRKVRQGAGARQQGVTRSMKEACRQGAALNLKLWKTGACVGADRGLATAPTGGYLELETLTSNFGRQGLASAPTGGSRLRRQGAA